MRATLMAGVIFSALIGSIAFAATAGSRFDPADFASLGALDQSSGTIEFNTDSLTVTGFPNGVLATSQSGQTPVAVYTFDGISLYGSVVVNVTGSRPIVLLSQSDVYLDAPIRVDAGNATGATGGTRGPGGSAGGNGGLKGSGPGGGAYRSGDAGGGGGYGGAGGMGADGTLGGPAYGDAALTEIAGGSGGGGGSTGIAGGGGGGGSIELCAVNLIFIYTSGLISASGGEGFSVSSISYYPGGGGSGGAVLLSAPAVEIYGSIVAKGGDGGDCPVGGAMDGGGGGGGGRVAIYADSYTGETISVAGGLGGTADNPGQPGAAGTIHIHSPTPPLAANASVSVWSDTPLQITLGAADDGLPNPPGALAYMVMTLPAHGVLADPAGGSITAAPYALAAGGKVVTYTASPGYAGPDSFTFLANDGGTPPGGGDSNTASVSITVIGCVEPPTPSWPTPADAAPDVPVNTQLTWGAVARISGEARTDAERQQVAGEIASHVQETGQTGPPTISDYSAETLEASAAGRIQILAFKGHSDNTASGEYENTLNAIAQHFTDFDVTATTSEAPATLAAELVGKNVFLVPEQETWTSSAMAAWGNSIASVLQAFTNAGGVVIVADDTESSGLFANNTGLMTVGPTTGFYGGTRSCPVAAPAHPLMNGVPANLNVLNGNTSFSGTTNGTVLVTEGSNAVVIAREVGAGGIVLMAFDFYSYNSDMARVIANAVQWRYAGASCPVSYDVLFGTQNPPTTVLCNDTALLTCNPGALTGETTYYWQVIASDAAGTTAGPVWSFTTVGCPTPPTPAGPSPDDAATNVKIDADLTWSTSLQTGEAQKSPAPVIDPTLAWWQTEVPTDWCATQERFAARMRARGLASDAALCGTQGICDEPARRDLYTPNPSTPIKTYRLKFHVFCDDAGGNCAATQASVDAQMTKVNADYLPWRIQFVYETEFVNSTQYLYWSSADESPMKYAYAETPTQKLNVFVVNNSESYSVGTFPWDPDCLTYMGGIVVHQPMFGATMSTLTHEIGHNLGLWHTHHGVSEVTACSDCYELAGTAYGDTTGDFCSQTSPTPRNYNCSAPGGTDSCNGTSWGTTDYHNFMGYAPQSCRTEFESQQAGRFHCWSDEVLTGWLDPGSSQCPLTYDVYFGTTNPPTTLLCQNVASPQLGCDLGALSYATTYYWKVIAKNVSGVTHEGPVWRFTTLTCVAPPAPVTPTPASAATGVAPSTTLTWNGGSGGVDGCRTTYDVYLATTNPPLTKVGSALTVAEYDPPSDLTGNTTYYWKVVSTNPVGVTNGPVWSFTTGCAMPSSPTGPTPATAASLVPLTTWLAWTGSSTPLCPETYDVYFGTVNPPTSMICTGIAGLTCDPPGDLTAQTTYYWRVVARSAAGNTTGPVWSFSTVCRAPEAPGTPSPANAAVGVPLAPELSWAAPNPSRPLSRMDVQSAVASIVERSGILNTPIVLPASTSLLDGSPIPSRTLTRPEDVASVQTASDMGIQATSTFNVAVCGAGALYINDVRNKLLGTGQFASVTIIDAGVVTPTTAQLTTFDAVLVYFASYYLDRVGLGNVMADYVDAGGGVVCMLQEVAGPSYYMLGRWDSQGYYAIPRSYYLMGPAATLGTIFVPDHPILRGVTRFSGGVSSFRPESTAISAGSLRVADWSDGRPLVVTKMIGGTRRADVAFSPPSNAVASNFWDATTDGALLMANALTYVAGVDPCASTYDVYLGTTNPPTTKICSDLSVPSCHPASLQACTTYYWKVCAKNSSSTTCSSVWSFTTDGCQIPFDSDGDRDVDAADTAQFVNCLSGPGNPHGGGICSGFDADVDTDIDQEDFGRMQRCLSGSGVIGDPACR